MDIKRAYFARPPRHIRLSTRQCYLMRPCEGAKRMEELVSLFLTIGSPKLLQAINIVIFGVVLIRVPYPYCWIKAQWLSHTPKVKKGNMWTRIFGMLFRPFFLFFFSASVIWPVRCRKGGWGDGEVMESIWGPVEEEMRPVTFDGSSRAETTLCTTSWAVNTNFRGVDCSSDITWMRSKLFSYDRTGTWISMTFLKDMIQERTLGKCWSWTCASYSHGNYIDHRQSHQMPGSMV